MDHTGEVALLSERSPDRLGPVGEVYEPGLVQTLARIVDAEWEVMRPAFEGEPPSSAEKARTIIAKFTLYLAGRREMGLEELCRELHRAMQHVYPAVRGKQPISFSIAPC
jgi:hypothetical protein